jgi:hypothetical protein
VELREPFKRWRVSYRGDLRYKTHKTLQIRQSVGIKMAILNLFIGNRGGHHSQINLMLHKKFQLN